MIVAAIFIALFILVSALDDLMMDVLYLTTGRKQARRLTVEELSAAPPQQIAVLIPAWQEGAVIGEMLRTTLQLQRYPQTRYQLFVGVYPNDPETRAAVDAVTARHPNVHKVVNPQPGPTTKAGNLNAMYEAMTAIERATQRRFDVVVMHDAEDVVHPLAFKLYNYLIPTADMAQIPVLPIAPKATFRNFFRYLTAGTYADEFAENHLRHMLVREWFGGFVPSAGVGTALSRHAIDLLAEQGGGNPFLNSSLTEDYEMALRLSRAGCKTVYFLEGVERVENTGRIHLEYIATRETFPNEFWQAVKQKTRWIYGITMQNAAHAGWQGSLGQRYLLYRDVKGKFSNLLSVPAYLVTVWFGLHWLIVGSFPTAGPVEGPFRVLLAANTVLWAERQVVRFLALRQQYGTGEAVLSTLLPPLMPLRFLWGSLINLVATARAWQLHLFGSVSSKRRWAKTEHKTYAPPELLEGYRRRLGDVAVEHGVLAPTDVASALLAGRSATAPLGEQLVAGGLLDAGTLRTLLADLHQSWHLPMLEQFWEPAAARWLPEPTARACLVVPLLAHGPWLVVVADAPLSLETRAAIQQAAGADVLEVLEVLAAAESVEAGLAAVYALPAAGAGARPRLGNLLLDRGLITLPQLLDGLQEQARTGRHLGQALVELGYLSAQTLANVLEAQGGARVA